MNAYLEITGLSSRAPRHWHPSDPHSTAAARHQRSSRTAAIFSNAVAAVVAWAGRLRLANELNALDDRLLEDIGITREDIPAVVRGTRVRQPDSVPIQRFSTLAPRTTRATAGSGVSDKDTQIAA